MGIQSLGWEDPLEKEMATYSSILAWKIPWTEEPQGLQSMGSQRVPRNDWAHSHTHRLWLYYPFSLLGEGTGYNFCPINTVLPLHLSIILCHLTVKQNATFRVWGASVRLIRQNLHLPPEGMPVKRNPTTLSCTGCECWREPWREGVVPFSSILHWLCLSWQSLVESWGNHPDNSSWKPALEEKKVWIILVCPIYTLIICTGVSQSVHLNFPWVDTAQVSQRKHKPLSWAPNFVFHFTWWKTKWKFSDVKPTFHFLGCWSVAGQQSQYLKAVWGGASKSCLALRKRRRNWALTSIFWLALSVFLSMFFLFLTHLLLFLSPFHFFFLFLSCLSCPFTSFFAFFFSIPLLTLPSSFAYLSLPCFSLPS